MQRITFRSYRQKVAFLAQSCCAESQSYCAHTCSVCGKVQPWAMDNKWWNKFEKNVVSSNSCIIDEVDGNIGYQGKDIRIDEKSGATRKITQIELKIGSQRPKWLVCATKCGTCGT